MTEVAELLRHLDEIDVNVRRLGERLIVDGPPSAVTDELLATLSRLKPDLIRVLSSYELDDGCWLHGVSPGNVSAWWPRGCSGGRDRQRLHVLRCACPRGFAGL